MVGHCPAILGESVYYTAGVQASGTPNTIGFAGDWDSAFWGSVEGVSISISDQASITDGTITVGEDEVPNIINLWQRNMFAVRAEIEIGFQYRDLTRFRKLTDGTRV